MVSLLAVAGLSGIAQRVWAATHAATPARHRCSAWGAGVDGVVVDREGHGVPGALVIARPAAPAMEIVDPIGGAVVTDRAGHFHIGGLGPGDYFFVSVQSGHIGATPAMPVDGGLRVTISLAIEATRT